MPSHLPIGIGQVTQNDEGMICKGKQEMIIIIIIIIQDRKDQKKKRKNLEEDNFMESEIERH